MGIFKKERTLWYNETVNLADELANKSREDIMECLQDRDLIEIRTNKDPVTSVGYRCFRFFAYVPVCLVLLVLSAVKYIATGDQYLNSWAKKYRPVNWMIDLVEAD